MNVYCCCGCFPCPTHRLRPEAVVAPVDPARDASLGVGHIWTNVACPAYQSYDPADCICQ